MKFSIAAAVVVVGGATLVSAQFNLPSCAIPCFLTAAESTGCDLTDFTCQCQAANEAKIAASSGPCIEKACDAADVAKASSAGLALCATVSQSAVVAATSSAVATSTVVATTSATAAASSSSLVMPASSSAAVVASSASSTAASSSVVSSSSSVAASSSMAMLTSTAVPVVASYAPSSTIPSVTTYTGAAVNAAAGLGGAAVAAFMAALAL